MAECRVCRRMMTDWPGQGSVACEPCLINEMSVELTTLRQRAEAAERILGDIEESLGADRRSDHTMLPGIVKDTHAIMLERSDALAATEQEKARLVSAMTAESERLAKRVVELEGAVKVLAGAGIQLNGALILDHMVQSNGQMYGTTEVALAAWQEAIKNPHAKAAIDAAGGQHGS